MNLAIVVLFLIAYKLYMVNGQGKVSKECKSSSNADTCLMRLLMIGDPDYIWPEDMASMDKQCEAYKVNEKCIRDYATKCYPTFLRQVTNVFAYGAAKTNKVYCSSASRKESYISIGKCGNKIKPQQDKCMKQLITAIQGIENYPDPKMRLPLSCCNFHKLKACLLGNVAREGAPLCTESVYKENVYLADGYATDGLNLICSDYTEDSDKCAKLIIKTPKKLPHQKTPKSILPPFFNIMNSMPH